MSCDQIVIRGTDYCDTHTPLSDTHRASAQETSVGAGLMSVVCFPQWRRSFICMIVLQDRTVSVGLCGAKPAFLLIKINPVSSVTYELQVF